MEQHKINGLGISGNTRIGLFRKDKYKVPMYLTIKELEDSEYKDVHCYDTVSKKFIVSEIREVIKIGNRNVRSYRFSSDCNFGKSSFGTEDNIVAIPDQNILSYNGFTSLRHMEQRRPFPNKFISIRRKPYNEDVETCTSSFLISFDYKYEEVYTLDIKGYYPFVANGFLVIGFRGE